MAFVLVLKKNTKGDGRAAPNHYPPTSSVYLMSGYWRIWKYFDSTGGVLLGIYNGLRLPSQLNREALKRKVLVHSLSMKEELSGANVGFRSVNEKR